MNDLIKPSETTGTEVATLDTLASRFRAAALQLGGDPILKFAKGDYSIGDEDVPLGTQFVACVGDTATGYVKWVDKKKVDERIGRVADGFTAPLRESLGDTDKSLWEKDLAGQPRDPWALQWFLPMIGVEDGNRVVFATGSGGGKKAVGRLLRAFGDCPLRGDPTIRLDARSYKHPDYGKIDEPLFIILGWEKTPAAGEEMSDSIPF